MTDPAADSNHLESLLAPLRKALDPEASRPIDATAWFLGPKAENADLLRELARMAVDAQIDVRHSYMPDDPPIFVEPDEKHARSADILKEELKTLLQQLRGSIPLASYRNQSHMYWDITLPSAVGYFAAMLYNQNNVAAEASPVTTLLEVQVGRDLCRMLGFPVAQEDGERPDSWGHITCDGSVANGESMWAARNLKYLPVALAAAITREDDLWDARVVLVQTCQGESRRLIDLSTWELLNLTVDQVVDLPQQIEKQAGIAPARVRDAINAYSVQNLGMATFARRFLDTMQQGEPVVFCPATAHYSWPKTAALIGLGTDAVIPIQVDLEGRMDMKMLQRELDRCLHDQRPVVQVVAVMGSTEEGAVDPLADILELRDHYRSMGLDFVVHVDGAWGGYFRSLLRLGPKGYDPAAIIDYPQLYLSDYFEKHFAEIPRVDTLTLDPHKSGFVPYPAGGLCYRNRDMRELIAYTAPVVYHGGVDVSVGSYGIEGSKPGAAAAAVYLSHRVIPLDLSGYGRLLGRCLFNSKRLYAALVTQDLTAESNGRIAVHVTIFQRLPAERDQLDEKEIEKQRRFIAQNFVDCSSKKLIETVLGLPNPDEEQQKALNLFRAIGSDLSILTYAWNYSVDGKMNRDLGRMNDLNDRIFRELSLKPADQGKLPTPELFVTASALDPRVFGAKVVADFVGRAGADFKPDTPVKFLISTTQNPWLSTTSGENMIPQLIDVIRKTALTAAQAIDEQSEPAD